MDRNKKDNKAKDFKDMKDRKKDTEMKDVETKRMDDNCTGKNNRGAR